ncbi:SOS response-associated peptidase family protein [Kribbella sp. NPDC002412]
MAGPITSLETKSARNQRNRLEDAPPSFEARQVGEAVEAAVLHPSRRVGSIPPSRAVAGAGRPVEFWCDESKLADDPDAWLTSFTIITTTATDDVGRIHERMPMAVAQESVARST